MRLCQRLLINEIQYRKHEFAIAWIIPISTCWFTSQTYEPLERPTPGGHGKWTTPKGQL